MFLLNYLLIITGFSAFVTGLAVVAYDLYFAVRARRLPGEGSLEELPRPTPIRWALAGKMVAAGTVPILLGLSIVIIPSGCAGVRVSQISGTRSGTLYPGVHLIKPFLEGVALFDVRDRILTT